MRFGWVYPKSDERGLFAKTAMEMWVCWGDPPGSEAPGTLTADAKWAMLRDWPRDHVPSEVAANDFLEFSKDRIKHRRGKASP
jgi:hypothetical protein